MSWRKNWLAALAAKKQGRHSSRTDNIERLQRDMAAYLAKGGTIKPVVVREVVAHETIVQGEENGQHHD